MLERIVSESSWKGGLQNSSIGLPRYRAKNVMTSMPLLESLLTLSLAHNGDWFSYISQKYQAIVMNLDR